MSTRQIQSVFEDYQKARTEFVQTIADLASRPPNAQVLHSADIMSLLRPLLLDKVPSIQQSAALAIGRLSNGSVDLAEAVVGGDILPHVVYSMQNQNKFYKKSAALILRAISKHSPEMAKAVIDSGGLQGLQACLETFEPSVKESALWALSVIARQTEELATAVLDCGVVPTVVLCLNEADLPVRRTAAAVVGEICKHSNHLAESVTAMGAIQRLSASLLCSDPKLKRQALGALSQIAKHSVAMAELIVESDAFPAMLKDLTNPDENVRRNVAFLVRELVKHSFDLAQMVVNTGVLSGLVDYLGDSKMEAMMPAIQALGYISSFNEMLAMAVINSKAVLQLEAILQVVDPKQIELAGAAAWTAGQIGRHSSEHAQPVTDSAIVQNIVRLQTDPASKPELKAKTEQALKLILNRCTDIDALQPLLVGSPPKILEFVLVQFAKVLPESSSSRKIFIAAGSLTKINSIKAPEGSIIAKAIADIQAAFPPDVVQFYSPNYTDRILERVESFQPGRTAS